MATQTTKSTAQTLQEVCSDQGVSLKHTREVCESEDVGMNSRGNVKRLEDIKEPNFIAEIRKEYVLGVNNHQQHCIEEVNSLLQTALSRWSGDEERIERFISNQLQ